MNKQEIVKRYLLLVPGVFFVALGIAFTTKSDLGTSPISAIPYTMSLIIPALTYGNWTIIWNIMMVISQFAMLRKKSEIPQLSIQILICFMLGYFVDFCMFLIAPLSFENYILRLLMLVVGCALLAIGVYIQLIANVAMSPGDGHARVLAQVTKGDYSKVRIAQDMSFTAAAAIISLIFLHGLKGAREGTIISAFLVGYIVGIYRKAFKPIERRLEEWLTK